MNAIKNLFLYAPSGHTKGGGGGGENFRPGLISRIFKYDLESLRVKTRGTVKIV